MKQILAIFRKDARRFWPEILICCALLGALLLVYPDTWRSTASPAHVGALRFFGGEGPMAVLASCLVVLIPIAWLVLIARLVHCERLVGDNQFWLTRPYHWPRLFLAKLLFLAAFVYAPFFLMQCVLLREGGFHPAHYLGALLFNLLALTAVFLLPLLALSSLTTGFGRLMLVLLGVALVAAAAAVAGSVIPSNVITGVPDLISSQIGVSLLFCGTLAVALVLYARRRPKPGWLILIALTLILCSTAFFDPDRPLVGRYFPELTAGSAPPVAFAYGARDLIQPRASLTDDKRGVDLALPMIESGVQDGYAAIPQALRVTMTDARGVTWESPWQGYPGANFLPGRTITFMEFRMPRSTYDRMKASPMTLRLSVAVTAARKATESVIPLPADSDFVVPEIGVCKPTRWLLDPDDIKGIACRSAMNEPQLTYISAPWTSGGCKTAAPDSQPVTSGGWAGELDPGPAELGITSVWDANVNIPIPAAIPGRYGVSVNSPAEWSLCVGTPLRFTQYRTASRVREEVTLPNFRLPELAIGDRFLLIRPH